MRLPGNAPGTACFRSSARPPDFSYPAAFFWSSRDGSPIEQFFAFGWRIPFLASAALVLIGLYVRLTITETPVFQDALHRREQVKVPMLAVFRDHTGALVIGHACCRSRRSCCSI